MNNTKQYLLSTTVGTFVEMWAVTPRADIILSSGFSLSLSLSQAIPFLFTAISCEQKPKEKCC